jgi:hypothetical protein
MRVGGPYKITVSFVGFANFEDSDVYLQLGEKTKLLKINLAEESNQLKEVIVRGSRDNTFNFKEHAQTVINSDKIKALPSLSEI